MMVNKEFKNLMCSFLHSWITAYIIASFELVVITAVAYAPFHSYPHLMEHGLRDQT